MPMVAMKRSNIRGAKRHCFSNVSKVKECILIDNSQQQKLHGSLMSDAERVQDLQRKLYQKAKQEPKFRFYMLYDKLSVGYVIREAYRYVKANDGSAGVDGVSFDDIERTGRDAFIATLADDLRKFNYKPQPVRRVMIPKPNGKMRPLGIPTIRDRVAQMACLLVIESIFEADFEDSSYGFRPNRSAADAMRKIQEHLKEGKTEVFDADLSSYFDTIPHDKLMTLVAQRIADKHLLHIIKMWLKAPVKMEDGRMSGGKKNKMGTPQGGVISPLLANIYLHLVDRIVNRSDGAYKAFGVNIVRFADDFVLMARKMPKEILERFHALLRRMELTINAEKSRMVNAVTTTFDFLGFTVRYEDDLYGRPHKYVVITPSAKSTERMREKVRTFLGTHGHLSPSILTTKLNSIIRGQLNYYCSVGYPKRAQRGLRWYLLTRLNRYYARKSQRKCKLYGSKAFEKLVAKYGLIDPTKFVLRRTPVNA